MTLIIAPYHDAHRDAVIRLSLRAWAPVFEELAPAVPGHVYRAFYPSGWQARQLADVAAFLSAEAERAWVALDAGVPVGWMGLRLHPEDSMGELHILAVDPARQREGIAAALITHALAHMRSSGMRIAMVETGDDPGHAPSRATYERSGFARWPVARYFREL